MNGNMQIKSNAATEQAATATEISSDFKRLLDKEHAPSHGVFQDPARFAHAQRVATMLVSSNLVPAHFQGSENLGSAVIAVDMAFRLNMNPLMVMQQLYVVHGKPGWSAQFVIAVINASGEFSPIRFRFSGSGDSQQCIAYAKDLKSGEVLDSTPVSIALAKKEGWFQKNGSKWQSMPDQMLAYRAASFWGRIYAPEMFMGLPTVEEIQDMGLSASEPEAEIKPARTKPNLGAKQKSTESDPVATEKPAKEDAAPKKSKATPPPPEPEAAHTDQDAPAPDDGDLGPQKSEDAGPSLFGKFGISEKLSDKLKEIGVAIEAFDKWVVDSGRADSFIADAEVASTKLLSEERSLKKLQTIYGS